MNNADVLQLLNECSDDIDKVKTIIDSLGQTSNVVPYLTKYSIIRTCGTIEVAYKSLVADYCSKRTKAQVKNFIDNKVRESSQNPTYSNMCRLLGEFDENWCDYFKNLIRSHADQNAIQLSLTSLVDARNDFAHGGNPNITISDIIIHYSYCRIVIELMDSILV